MNAYFFSFVFLVLLFLLLFSQLVLSSFVSALVIVVASLLVIVCGGGMVGIGSFSLFPGRVSVKQPVLSSLAGSFFLILL